MCGIAGSWSTKIDPELKNKEKVSKDVCDTLKISLYDNNEMLPNKKIKHLLG